MAMREARRHHVGENGDFDRALERLKKERRLDLLRFCFWTSSNDSDLVSLVPSGTVLLLLLPPLPMLRCSCLQLLSSCRKKTQRFLPNMKDLSNEIYRSSPWLSAVTIVKLRPIIVKLSRRQVWNSKDENAREVYFWANLLWPKEQSQTRSIPVGAWAKGSPDSFFATYSSANSPPAKLIQDTMTMLQAHYPERIGQSLVLDALCGCKRSSKSLHHYFSRRKRDKQLRFWVAPILQPHFRCPVSGLRECLRPWMYGINLYVPWWNLNKPCRSCCRVQR